MLVESAADLIAKARAYGIVLAPDGKAFGNFRRAWLDACDDHLTVAQVIELESTPSGNVLIISGLEEVCKGVGFPNLLGPLRQKVTTLRQDGVAVVLLSSMPRIAYPSVAGSSLLQDAREFHPALREAGGDDHRLHPLPAWEPGMDEVEFLTGLVSELGISLVARLDELLFESPRRPAEALADLSSLECDALYFAGLIKPVDVSGYGWSVPGAIQDIKEAVADYLARSLDPPGDLAEAYEVLWRIERRIRAALRSRAMEQWESTWKDSLTSPVYSAKAIGRAGTWPTLA